MILGISRTERFERRNRRSGMSNRAYFNNVNGYLLFGMSFLPSSAGLISG